MAVLVLVLGAILLWLAPLIVAHTALRQKIISAALSDFEGSVTVGAASLGWLSPLAASDIAAYDAGGEPLAKVKSVRSEKSLLALLSDRNRPGAFRVEQPAIRLVLREDGSNWEDALAPYAESDREGSTEEFKLQVIGGVIDVRDERAGGQWRVDELNASFEFASNSPQEIRARVVGRVTANDAAPGKISADLVWTPGQSPEQTLGDGQLAVRAESLQLGPLAKAAQRLVGDVQLHGTLTCDTFYQWSAGGERNRIQIDRLAAQDVSFRTSGWPADDRLQTALLNCSGQIEADSSHWRISNLAIDSDFGRLQATGTVPAESVASGKIWADMLGELQKEDIQINGDIDAAKLAGMMPLTLRIRDNTKITSGKLQLSLSSKSTGAPSFTARLEAENLAAVADGHRIAWEPVLLTGQFRQTKDGPIIDQLVCRSSFLDVSGEGTLAQGSATINGDLKEMAAEVGQLIDLGGLELEGRLNGELRWRRNEDQQIAGNGHVALADFKLAAPDRPSWEEKELVVDVVAKANTAGSEISKVDTASLTLQSGSDRLVAELMRPVKQPTAQTAWPLRLSAGGQLDTWIPRLQPLFTLAGWNVEGTVDLNATATVAAGKIDAEAVNVRVDGLHAESASWLIDEPRVQLETKGSWDQSKGQMVANATTMTSSTVAFRAEQLVLQFPNETPAVSGTVSYRADLGRIGSLLSKPGQPADQQVVGSVTGMIQASYQASVTQVDWSADIKDLVYAARNTSPPAYEAIPVSRTTDWQEVWREPTLKLAGRKRYDHKQDRLTVGSFTGTSDTLQVSAKGTIESLSMERVADLTGQIDYDLADVTRMLGAYLGPKVKLVGRDKAEFKLSGPLVRPGASSAAVTDVRTASARDAVARPLVSPELTANANFGWQSANVHGLLVGEGELVATLSGGVVNFAPLDVPVSEGRFKMSPWIDTKATPVSLHIKKGPLAENVRISQEMCHTWLKYIAPLLAEATRAEGRFSISLDGAQVPLTVPDRSEVHGELDLHAAQIGPGPLAQQYLAMAQQVKTIVEGQPLGNGLSSRATLNVPQQKVKFDVKNGRVYHQNFSVVVGDVEIRTSGSVGFDQSLDLVAELPIRDNWVDSKPYLAALRGTVVRIPVQGTFANRRFDNRALRDLNRQLIGNAAGRLLEDGLNRGLERLIRPPR
ncbi:MAG: hypothetical protein ISR77_03835 [Pirellulaceae bacterium]|nr:hypothetical protein [Pirellulaceae bacterium]